MEWVFTVSSSQSGIQRGKLGRVLCARRDAKLELVNHAVIHRSQPCPPRHPDASCRLLDEACNSRHSACLSSCWLHSLICSFLSTRAARFARSPQEGLHPYWTSPSL